MIYIVFCDRLGNNLFQLAAALSLSAEITICVPLENEYQFTLKYKDTFFKGFPILNYVPDGISVYEESFYHYSEIPYKNGTDLIIKGYFQSYKYLNRDRVLKQYAVDKDTMEFIQLTYPKILKGGYTSIHIRRGDYLKVLHKHPFCGIKYYLKAINLIGKNENFIVVSDDIAWCKNNLKLKNIIYVENTSPIIDLYIQSFCDNNILSNSSFSWWGAYLNDNNNKKVILPSLWFGYRFKVDVKDLILPSYIVIKNRYSLILFLKSVVQVINEKKIFLKKANV
jgi:hypothetical protein